MAAAMIMKEHYDASPEKVFEVASDFHNAADNIGSITKCEVITDGPVGVGTRFRETRLMFKRECTEEMEVVEFDPPRSYTLGAESCGCRYRTQLRFTRNGKGTDLEFRFEAQPLTFFAKVMGFLMKPMMKTMMKECRKHLVDLKKVVESDADH